MRATPQMITSAMQLYFTGESLRNVERFLKLQGYQIYHNYMRPHEGLNGKTPAEKCGIRIEGKNKWITLIQNAHSDLLS
jgi:hypothetical protein